MTRSVARSAAALLLLLGAAPLVSCGSESSGFALELRYLASLEELPQSQRDVFEGAAQRIRSIVKGGLRPVTTRSDGQPLTCGDGADAVALDERVEGLLILVSVRDLGPGTLAQSGPCIVRQSSRLPAVAILRFNSTYIDTYENTGQLGAVVLHEMLHTLGFGTVWEDFPGLVTGPLSEPAYNGDAALAAAKRENSAPASWTAIPVENCGTGSPIDCSPAYEPSCCLGTRDAHWRETVFGNELMTGWVTPGASPLSAMSIGALQDLGYRVELRGADAFSLAPALRSFTPVEPVFLGDDVLRDPPKVADEP